MGCTATGLSLVFIAAFSSSYSAYAIDALDASDSPVTNQPAALYRQLNARNPATRSAAACEIGKLGPAGAFAVPRLVAMLRDEASYLAGDINGHDIHATPAESAADALAEIGAPSVGALMRATRDPDPDVRSRSVYSLARIGDPRAVDALVRAMRDRDRNVRLTAAIWTHQTDEKLLDATIRALNDRDESVRWEASKNMQSYADNPRALAPMIEALGNNTTDVQIYILIALGKLGDSAAVPAVIQLLENPSAGDMVRGSAAQALGSATDAESFAALLRAADNANWWIRSGALQALGARRNPQGVPRLILSLANDNMTERLIAAQSLGAIGDPRAIAPLSAVLDDPQPAVRKEVVAALAKIEERQR